MQFRAVSQLDASADALIVAVDKEGSALGGPPDEEGRLAEWVARESGPAKLFTAPPGTGTAAALRTAQLQLMEEPATSHPYYWSGFAVIGDGTVPVIRTDQPQVQSGH